MDFVLIQSGTNLYLDDRFRVNTGKSFQKSVVARVIGGDHPPSCLRLAVKATQFDGTEVDLTARQFVYGSLTTHRWCSCQNIEEARLAFSGEMLRRIVEVLKENRSGLTYVELATKLDVNEHILKWLIWQEELEPTLDYRPMYGLKSLWPNVFIVD